MNTINTTFNTIFNTTSNYIVRKTTDPLNAETNGMVQVPISRTDGAKGKSGMCILAPIVSDSVLTVIYNDPAGHEWLRSIVDSLRAKVASECNKAGKTITSETIGVTKLLEAMKAEESSSRLTKESIAAWFDSDMSPLLQVAIAEKFGTISNEKVTKILESYKAGYQVCANRKDNRSMATAMRNTLLNQFDKFPNDYDNTIANKIIAILPTISEMTERLDAL